MEYLKPDDGPPLGLDRYSRLILKATRYDAKSGVEISKKCGIPIAKCFNRIKRLEKDGYLIETDKVSTKEGKEVSVYRSDLDDGFRVSSHARAKT